MLFATKKLVEKIISAFIAEMKIMYIVRSKFPKPMKQRERRNFSNAKNRKRSANSNCVNMRKDMRAEWSACAKLEKRLKKQN